MKAQNIKMQSKLSTVNQPGWMHGNTEPARPTKETRVMHCPVEHHSFEWLLNINVTGTNLNA